LILEDLLHILAQHRVQLEASPIVSIADGEHAESKERNLAGLVVMVFGNATDDNVSVGDDATWLMIVVHDRNHTHTLLLHELRSLENAVILLEEVGVLGADLLGVRVHLVSVGTSKVFKKRCTLESLRDMLGCWFI